MVESVKIQDISGMNNVQQEGNFTPKIVLNMDITKTKKAVKRTGYIKKASFSNAHSLFSLPDYLVLIADGVLYPTSMWKVTPNGVKTELFAVVGSRTPVSYELIDSVLYMSSKRWVGIYDVKTLTARSWGTLSPPAPTLSLLGTGNLPSGTYRMLSTVMGNSLSASSSISTIVLASSGGIKIDNYSSSNDYWLSGLGDTEFYLQPESSIIESASGIELLPRLGLTPAPFMEYIKLYYGHIYGAIKNKLVYSEPFAYEWFHPDNVMYFDSPITLIAPSPQGLYVGTSSETFFLSGRTPTELVKTKVGDGALPYSLTQGELKANEGNVPIWVSAEGIVSGIEGKIVNLTKDKIKYDLGSSGASLFKQLNGEPQVLSVFQQPANLGMADSVTATVIRNGQLYTGKYNSVITDAIRVSDSIIVT